MYLLYIFFSVLKASKTIDELYPTDREEYDNYGIPDFDFYSDLVDETEEMENNNEKVNLISFEQNYITTKSSKLHFLRSKTLCE